MYVDQRFGQTPRGAAGLARRIVMMKSRFFGVVLLSLKWVEDKRIGTMATDGTHLIANPDWCEEIGPERCAGVMVHEASHVINRHHLRMAGRPLKRWNVATDLAINPAILRDGWLLPDNLLLDREKRFPKWTAEAIDAKLAEDKKEEQDKKAQKNAKQQPPSAPNPTGSPQSKQDSNADDEDSGGGNNGDDGNDGDEDDGDDAAGQTPGSGSKTGTKPAESSTHSMKPAESWGEIRPAVTATGQSLSPTGLRRAEERLDQVIRNAARYAASGGQSTPWIEEIVRATGTRPSWQGRLTTSLAGTSATATAWSRPNRRYMQSGIWMPGRTKTGSGKIVLVLDTSGSSTAYDLVHYTAGFCGAIEETQPEQVVLIQCDHEVTHVQWLEPGETPDQIIVRGGRGTRFQPAFDWVKDNIDADAIVYATDLDCYEDYEDPGIPVLWLTGSNCKAPSFGEVVPVQ